MDDARDAHFRSASAEVAGVRFRWTPGCRGHPLPPAGWGLLVGAARDLQGEVLDASGLLGVPGRAVRSAHVTVLEGSAAGLAAARADLLGPGGGGPAAGGAVEGAVPVAGLPWDAPSGRFDHVLAAPPAERGSARVRAEIAAAARSLVPGGALWLLLEKDRGAKRYEKEAAAAVGRLEVVARERGWRLSRATSAPRAAGPEVGGPGVLVEGDAPEPWLRFETPDGPAHALPGTYAAGKTDPGTAVLLEVLSAAEEDLVGRPVLDLGCGWGPLARWAVRRGAAVAAVDDDLAAVRSARRNAEGARVVHSDLDAALPDGERFDRILVNPPFHLGSGVRMALPLAFLEAAARRLRPDGIVWIVANEALPYEPTLTAEFADVREVVRERGFKVLRARAGNAR